MAVFDSLEGFVSPHIPHGPLLLVKFSRFDFDQNLWSSYTDYVCSTLWVIDDMYHLQLPSGSLIHLSRDFYSLNRVLNCSTRFAKKHFPELFPSGDAIIV